MNDRKYIFRTFKIILKLIQKIVDIFLYTVLFIQKLKENFTF